MLFFTKKNIEQHDTTRLNICHYNLKGKSWIWTKFIE